jgi:DNA-binding NarL/FixJ family response regulator
MWQVVSKHSACGEREVATVVFCGVEVDELLLNEVQELTRDLIALPNTHELERQLRTTEWGCIIAGENAVMESEVEALGDFGLQRPGFLWMVWASNLGLASVVSAMQRGAFSVVERQEDPQALIISLKNALALAQQRYTHWRNGEEVQQRLTTLSCSERHVLSLILKGLTNKRISQALDMSLRTVESRRQKILSAMQTENIISLAAILARHGLLDPILSAPDEYKPAEPQSVSA